MSALAFLPLDLQHPHLVVVDGSKLVRKVLLGLMGLVVAVAAVQLLRKRFAKRDADAA